MSWSSKRRSTESDPNPEATHVASPAPAGLRLVGRGAAALGGYLGFWLIFALMVLPSSAGALGSAVAAPAPMAIHATATASVHHVSPPSSSPISVLAGANPAGEPYYNAPLIATQNALHLANLSLEQNQLATRAGAATPAKLLPLGPGYSIGSFTGYVRSLATGKGLAGVTVQAYSSAGAFCPINTCAPVATNGTGGFKVTCPSGPGYVQTSNYNFYMSNLTYATCRTATNTDVGTIYLIQDAVVTGVVRGNTPKHEAIYGVIVTASSRDLLVTGTPTGTSLVDGSFTVAVPPLPSRIDFSAPPGYFSNFTYLNATPGANINIGTIYLDRQVLVRAELYDEVTKGAVPGFTIASLTVCSALISNCVTQGQVGSSVVEAFGPVGPDIVHAQATGYVESVHAIGYVPRLAPGKVFDVGKIYLLPLGGFAINVGVTMNRSHSNSLPYTTGWYDVSVSGLDGYELVGVKINPVTGGMNTTISTAGFAGCAPEPQSGLGGFVAFPAAPLRSEVTVYPDTTPLCNPFAGPQWPIPGDLPVWNNNTIVNVTPYLTTNGGYLNLTPGTYMEGNITILGTGKGPTDYQVVATSASVPGIPSYAYQFSSNNPQGTSPWMCGNHANIPAPSAATGHTFCAPVPPGAVELRISSIGFPDNWTWAYTQPICCNSSEDPAPMGTVTTPTQTGLNFSILPGATFGRILQGNTSLAGTYGAFKVCTASSNPFLGCWSGVANLDGTFFSPAPRGWDYVTVSAAGYSPNTAWVYVNGNDSVGNISLTPLATLTGQVVDSNGHGIYEAQVQVCPVAQAAGTCTQLGAGLTSTDGHYNGTTTGGWLPWTTYRIQASASGYTTDWAWVNATPGFVTVVPTLVLSPVGQAAPVGHSGAGSSTSATPAGIWVDGTLLDNVTGAGVQPSSVQACPTDGGACTLFPDGANQGGYFNGSIAPGLYNLSVGTPGYYPINQFFNATGKPFIHLGTIYVEPLGWVNGFVALNPWTNMSIRSGSKTYTFTEIPGSTVSACSGNGFLCGQPVAVDSIGYFNASVPAGLYDKIAVVGSYAGGGPSAPGGFNTNHTVFNSTSYYTTLDLSQRVYVDLFGGVSGLLRDNSTFNRFDGVIRLPVQYGSVSAQTTGANNANVVTTTGGGGNWIVLLPPGNPYASTSASGIIVNWFYPKQERFFGTIEPGMVYSMTNLSLDRYGWTDVQLRNSVTYAGAGYIGVSASYNDVRNQTTWTTSGPANQYGFANLSAPVGPGVLVSAGPGVDYNITNATISVNASESTFVHGVAGNLTIPPWGWVMSFQVNYSVAPVIPTIIDQANGLPLPGAAATVASTEPGLTGQGQANSNWMGQFLTDAPIGPKDAFTIVHAEYLANKTILNVDPGQTIVFRTINMTGDGILAGKVVSFPSGQPVSGALITACPKKSVVCTQATTNASGLYWITAAPGLEDLTVDASGFVSNSSVVANACSDCWTWLGPITVAEFAYVSGVVRGLPSGLPIINATVSICSTLGSPVGPCVISVQTGPVGNFLLPTPAGNYILEASDPFYNNSYLPIALSPGQHVTVGTIFLSQFGALVGTVDSASTFSPVFNASVLACPTWATGTCVPLSYTSAAGHFVLRGAPGPYTLTVSAGGYTDAYVPAKIVSGITVTLATILLYPTSTAQMYTVSGHVVNASNVLQGIPGAVVGALVNGTPAFSGFTDAAGAFSIQVAYGSYILSVAAAGWRPSFAPLTVHGPVTGMIVQLSPMTYTVTGYALDGLTHQPLPGVQITENTGQGVVDQAVTDSSGLYSMSLANGTHYLLATYQGGGSVPYSPVPFGLTINGASQLYNIDLYPPSTTVVGTVVDHSSGLGLSGASVTVAGTTVNGVPISVSVTTDPSGGFTLPVVQGSYNVTASLHGYAIAIVPFSATQSSTAVTVSLVPLVTQASSPPGTANGMAGFMALGALAAATVALAFLGAWWVTRRQAKAAKGAPARSPAPKSR